VWVHLTQHPHPHKVLRNVLQFGTLQTKNKTPGCLLDFLQVVLLKTLKKMKHICVQHILQTGSSLAQGVAVSDTNETRVALVGTRPCEIIAHAASGSSECHARATYSWDMGSFFGSS